MPVPLIIMPGHASRPLNVVGEKITMPGTLVHLPAGTTHWFRFGKGGCEMVSMTSRESASGLFADIDREISLEKPDLGKLIEIARRHGLVVIPPPS